jgi:superfamily II DNA/RNA helicase
MTKQALEDLGFSTPTTIQQKAFAPIMAVFGKCPNPIK